MYIFLGLLILLLVYHIQEDEGFTIRIEGPDLDPIQESFQSVKDGIHKNIIRPTYSAMMGFIPYKHHFRKLRRHIR